MRSLLVTAGVAMAMLGVAATAHAQDEDADRPEMRARVVVDKASGAQLTRPEGWVVGKKGKGVAAVFRAAGDPEAQIEVRVSPHVKADQRKSFFTSFHANLQKAGFVKKQVNAAAAYKDKQGVETEYETSSKKRAFRLVVWQFHREDTAFIVVGFFPTKTRDRYYPDFQAVIESMTF
jgi:hypothetical protein